VTYFTGNFEQYGLQSRYVDLVVADSAAPPWRQGSKLFDSIITDPPYGIREPTEKVGTTRKNPEVPKEFLDVHFPQKVNKKMKCRYNIMCHNSSIQIGLLVSFIFEDYF
jgi:tRNA (guanine10-N2)-methyltransferase